MEVLLLRLKDKVAIVTGAASGMGKAIAEAYAKQGAKVVVSDMNIEGAEEVAEQIKRNGGEAFAIETNVTNDDHIATLFKETASNFGPVNILVNNAGIMDNVDPVDDITDEQWDKVFAVNTGSVMKLTRQAVNIFLDNDGGTIVNNISVGGLYGARAGAAYTASKHAVVGLTKNTAFMYMNKNIRCNGFAPGGIETNIQSSMTGANDFGVERQMAGISSNGRMGQSEEVAQLALFLGSDESIYVNGQIISIDGGWTAY